MNAKLNLNLRFCSYSQLSFFFNKYRNRIATTIIDPDQKNFLTAISFKNEGILKSQYKEPLGKDEQSVKEYFDQAISWYRKVNPSYLAKPESIVGSSGSDEMVVPIKTLFIFPDFRTAFHPMEPRSFFYFYYTDDFLEYIIDNQLFDTFYPSGDELKNISNWLNDYNVNMFFPAAFFARKIRYEVLQKLALEFERRKEDQSQELNILYLNLGLEAQKAGEKENMLRYYRKLQPNNLLNILRSKEFGGNINIQSFRLIAYVVKGYIQTGNFEEAHNLVAVFKKPTNRSSLYAFVASEMLGEKQDIKIIRQMIDSARTELNRTQNVTGGQPNREVLAYALAMQDPDGNLDEINLLIKNLPQKFSAIQNTCRAFAFHDELYQSEAHIPRLISDDDQADFLWNILYGYSMSGADPGAEWLAYHQNYRPFIVHQIGYVDESN
jgi:hypothetical protein